MRVANASGGQQNRNRVLDRGRHREHGRKEGEHQKGRRCRHGGHGDTFSRIEEAKQSQAERRINLADPLGPIIRWANPARDQWPP